MLRVACIFAIISKQGPVLRVPWSSPCVFRSRGAASARGQHMKASTFGSPKFASSHQRSRLWSCSSNIRVWMWLESTSNLAELTGLGRNLKHRVGQRLQPHFGSSLLQTSPSSDHRFPDLQVAFFAFRTLPSLYVYSISSRISQSSSNQFR
jgi:hypothetical protein